MTAEVHYRAEEQVKKSAERDRRYKLELEDFEKWIAEETEECRSTGSAYTGLSKR